MNSKTILAPFLASAFALCFLAQPMFADTFGLFTYTDNGTSITIDSYPDNAVGAVAIPATIIDKPVTAIGRAAFWNCTGLTNVFIPNSVTSIGYNAFWLCTGLTSVSIGSGVTSIGGNAFSGCTGLTSVSIPNSVTSIGATAFSGCTGLSSVSIGSGVTSIEDKTFEACTGLTSVSIPDSVTSIGGNAFSGCTGLSSATLGSGVTSIGYRAFSHCKGLTSVSIGNGLIAIGNNAFEDCASLTSVYIPNSVTSIGDSAFYRCYCLTSVSMGSGVTSIGEMAFYGCFRLTNISIPNSVKSVGHSAFVGCIGLTGISIPNSVTSIGNEAFKSCNGLISVSIGNGVTSIGEGTFVDCTGLPSVTIPNSVTSIGRSAFHNCTGLTSVTIPNSVTSIGSSAFYGCSGLTRVTIGTSVTSIGGAAFSYCTGLTSVSIPNSVTSIGEEAFKACIGLTSVAIGNGVTSIGTKAFVSCIRLSSVSISNGVTSIGTEAFSYCTDLASVSIGTGVTSIGDGMFLGCSSLTAITVDPANAAYSSEAGVLFNHAKTTLILFPTGKTGVYSIPNSVVAIGDKAFYQCTGLASVSIPNSVTSIGASAFYYCTGLTNCSIGTGVTSIGNEAFYNCSRLASVSIPNSVTSIGSFAFYSCTGLTNCSIGTGVTSISNDAFSGCTSLSSISLPISVTSIGEGAFYNCTSLISAIFPGNPPEMGVSVFDATAGGFTVYYQPGSIGFTTPTWYGYPARVAAPEIELECPAGSGLVDGSASVDFGGVALGSSASKIFTIKNTGTADLTGLAVTAAGANSGFFAVGTPGVTTLAPFTSTTFSVTFAPGAVGQLTASIHIASNDSDENPFDITLTGTGVIVPEIAVEQPLGTDLKSGSATRNFGSVLEGQSGTATSFTIKNTGSANLTGLAISISGFHSGDFVVAGPSATTVAPGASATFTVAFKPSVYVPSEAGLRTAALHIASNDANENPFDITLTGTAIACPEIVVYDPEGTNLKSGVSSRSFGSVAVKSKAAITKTFSIWNLGTANLTSLAITKSGTNAKDFTVTPPLKTTLAPRTKTTFKVIFKPSVKGTRKAAIHIKSNDNNESPFDIALTGKGVAKKAAPPALASAARLPSWPASGNSAWLAHEIRQSSGTAQLPDGRRYLTLTVIKSPEDFLPTRSVEVSPNLIDWFSGRKHTTVITDDTSLLKVRDNTPLTPGKKRYIRMGTTRH